MSCFLYRVLTFTAGAEGLLRDGLNVDVRDKSQAATRRVALFRRRILEVLDDGQLRVHPMGVFHVPQLRPSVFVAADWRKRGCVL